MWDKLQSMMEGLFDKFKGDLIEALTKDGPKPSGQNARKCDEFFAKMDRMSLALTYGDVRLKPGYSEILPADVDLRTFFSRNISLNIPIVSSPMDTVTGSLMAIRMAILGGLGVIHKGMSPKEQASAIGKVKHYLSAFVTNPITVSPDDTVEAVLAMKEKKGYRFSSFPVIDSTGKVIGLVTGNDFDFCMDHHLLISQIMSKEIIGIEQKASIDKLYSTMSESRKKILPVLDDSGGLQGIYTLADVKRIKTGKSNKYNLDSAGRLRVGAAIGKRDMEERMELLSRQGVDVVVVDAAHGHTKDMAEVIRFCKKNYPGIDVVAGNISESEAALFLAQAGADGIRVGQGPGSICTTRIVAGIGCPQVTAVYNCAKAVRGFGIGVCADGGIEHSGDIPIALGAGASCVMLGNMLAGTKESPGEVIFRNGKAYKVYRGMGSLEAMVDHRTSRERYGLPGDTTADKLVPEGVKGEVDYKGELPAVIFQLVEGAKSGFGYVGARSMEEFQAKADFHRISNAGLEESHPHGLSNIQNTTNYRV